MEESALCASAASRYGLPGYHIANAVKAALGLFGSGKLDTGSGTRASKDWAAQTPCST